MEEKMFESYNEVNVFSKNQNMKLRQRPCHGYRNLQQRRAHLLFQTSLAKRARLVHSIRKVLAGGKKELAQLTFAASSAQAINTRHIHAMFNTRP